MGVSKNLEMKTSPWVIWWALNPMTSVLTREDPDTQRRKLCEKASRDEVMWPQVEEWVKLPDAGKGRRLIPPQTPEPGREQGMLHYRLAAPSTVRE